jgi:hypothetical protein
MMKKLLLSTSYLVQDKDTIRAVRHHWDADIQADKDMSNQIKKFFTKHIRDNKVRFQGVFKGI